MEPKSGLSETTETCRIEVELSAEDLHRLDEQAHLAGMDRAGYVSRLIRQSLDAAPGEKALHLGMTFAGILAPVHEYSRRMGYTEEELDALFEQAREEVNEERRAGKRPPKPSDG